MSFMDSEFLLLSRGGRYGAATHARVRHALVGGRQAQARHAVAPGAQRHRVPRAQRTRPLGSQSDSITAVSGDAGPVR